MQTRTNNPMTCGKKGQLRKTISFNQNTKITHRKLRDKLFEAKGSFSKIDMSKGIIES